MTTSGLAENPIWLAALQFPQRLQDSILSAGDDSVYELKNVLPGRTATLVIADEIGPGGPGDIYASLAQRYCRFPVVHLTSPEVPSFVNETTLFLVLGSAETNSTLADTVYAASRQGARLLAFSGSERTAASIAVREAKGAILTIKGVAPWTEAGLAEILAPGVILLEALEAVPTAGIWLLEAADELATLMEPFAADGGLADKLARKIGRTFPMFVGAGILGEVLARTWKACFNVTCRAPAFASTLTDAATVEVHGWGQHGDVTRQVLSMVMLRHDDEHPEVELIASHLLETIREFTHTQVIVPATGQGLLTQFVELLLLAQLVALRRADQEGLVPSPTTSYRL